jgi:ketosteroid isomerase-like protein
MNTNRNVVIRFVEAINNHDVDEIINLMTDDHVFIDGQDNKNVGKEGMTEGWKGYFDLFPDYQIEIADIVDNDPAFGLFGYVEGTYQGIKNESNSNFWRTPASWKAKVKDEKIYHWQVYCDYSVLLKIIDQIKQEQ